MSPERGVAYFGHIPHGFDEKGMREYLSQFGEVTNLRFLFYLTAHQRFFFSLEHSNI